MDTRAAPRDQEELPDAPAHPQGRECGLLRQGEVMRLPRGSAGRNRLPMQETRDQSLGWEDPVEKGMATSPGFLPGESHGQRILAGHSP